MILNAVRRFFHYTTEIYVENAEFTGSKTESNSIAQSLAEKADSMGIPSGYEELYSSGAPF